MAGVQICGAVESGGAFFCDGKKEGYNFNLLCFHPKGNRSFCIKYLPTPKTLKISMRSIKSVFQ